MNLDNLIWLFAINDSVLKVNVEGVTHAESLIRPAPGGNCINWTVGHLLRSREFLIKFAGGEWAYPAEAAAVVQRGSTGGDLDAFPLWEEQLLMWNEAQALLIEAIGKLDSLQLAAETPPLGDFARPDTLERCLLFLYFHETYHIGQLGLLRRLIGKEGAIR